MNPERLRQIEDLYHSARECEPDKRSAFLSGACRGDPELRREVESLLAQDPAREGILDRPPADLLEASAVMMLTAGARLGPYQIEARIGAGGMGEVYRARDSKLGREVAIKVLPEVFAHDPDRLARFQREAKMLASLNHPNIATIHGLEQSGDTSYLVMELVSGETLAERVKAGPLGIEEALRMAVQIAEALEAAHEKSIIHRDLKPTNVKVTPEGKVKVLDFGLAKAFVGDAANDDPSNSPTLSAAATKQGTILGTAAYMSPEQARGKSVDKRTDIWAFGCVLYELLTGRRAFQGETASDTIAAMLEREPDWQALPLVTPTKIRDVLRRCLQKDSQLRLRDIGDARIEIQGALNATATADSSDAPKGIRALGRPALILSAGTLLLGAAIAGLATWNLKPSPPSPPRAVTRSIINLPPGRVLAGFESGPAVAISPDGTRLVYAASQGGIQRLYLRAMDSLLEAQSIPDTEGASSPFFSPDSQWLGFLVGENLKKISVSGGTAVTLANDVTPMGANWGSQGMIAFAPTQVLALQQVSEAGGPPQPLTLLGDGASHRWPEFLPGGKALLFAAGTTPNWTNAQIAVQTVGSGERRNLTQGGTQPRYAPSGHLVYAQAGSLMAVPFDPERLRIKGASVPVVHGVVQSISSGAAQYSISTTGTLVYVPGGVQGAERKLVWVDRNGAEQPLAAPTHAYESPRFSPDGQRIAVVTDGQVWLYDLPRETLTRFTFEGNANSRPVWTPDGKRIVFYSNKDGPLNLFWQLADGGGGLERLTTSEDLQAPTSWSPDGQFLAFNENSPTTGDDILVLQLSDRKVQPFLRTPFDESNPRFSPDGRWIAYMSDESGRNEIYVQPFPGPGGKLQVSRDGGREPVWNRNGRELFYRSGNKMVAVEMTTQPNFALGNPRVLFERPNVLAIVPISNYDVSPDGRRFLMVKPTEQTQAAPTQINVVLNWFEELKQKVSTGKN
jgi:serine/threonine protein kinase/Tol biopolymer transport system component